MRERALVLAAMILAMSPPAARAQEFEVGHVPACFEAVPAAVSLSTAPPLDVRVHVVLDQGISVEEGRQQMAPAQRAYEAMGLRLVPNFTTARMSSDDTRKLFDELKALVGGQRPPWAHLVYLLTKRDISAGGRETTAGIADCIGGVAFPDRAFAIGQVGMTTGAPLGPFTLFDDEGAKIAAHEIGHLFGAHHHYSNCAEGAVDEEISRLSPCTLMANDVGLVSLRFSPPNGAIVRGHAVTYLDGLTVPPPPDGSATTVPRLDSCDTRAYRDPSGDPARIVPTAPDDVDLLGGTFHAALVEGREVVRFRWKLLSLDGDFGPDATLVRYSFDIVEPWGLRIEATWDGKSPPSAAAVAHGNPLMDLEVALTPGPGGVIDVDIPLEALELRGATLKLGPMTAVTDAGELFQSDTAEPLMAAVQPAGCLGDAPAPAASGTPGPGPAPEPPSGAPQPQPPAATARLRLKLLRQSARRRKLRVLATGTARALRLRLVDGRGRTVGRGRADGVDGSRVIVVRLLRRPRAGRHVLVLTARTSTGTPVKKRLAVRVRR